MLFDRYTVFIRDYNHIFKTHSDEFTGPRYIQVFRPAGFTSDVLTITCYWNDGLFRNDYYVVGVIADSKELEGIIKGIAQ